MLKSSFRRLSSSYSENFLWTKIRSIRQNPNAKISVSDRNEICAEILSPKGLEKMTEKHLSLTLSCLLDTRNIPKQRQDQESLSPVITKLVERIIEAGLTLQGCNQILGAFAKLKTNGIAVDSFTKVCDDIFRKFLSEFFAHCPNRELSNIFWAASVLELNGATDLLRNLSNILPSMDCVDVSLICAGLMDKPNETELWKFVIGDLKKRDSISHKDIASIMCSIACAGTGDMDLMQHLVVNNIVPKKLVTVKNAPGIVWAVSASEYVHYELLEQTAQVLENSPSYFTFAPLDLRRISRAFAMAGKLDRIEDWLMGKIYSSTKKNDFVADSVLVWELAINDRWDHALKLFRSRSIEYWKSEIAKASIASSQLYTLYLASLGHSDHRLLTNKEETFLLSLQSAFADSSENMNSSVLHRQASEALAELKIDHVSEYKEPISGFVVDMYIPSRNIAIEVQGPSHFQTDLKTGKVVSKPTDTFKHSVLRSVANMKVVQITPWNFGPKIRVNNRILMRNILNAEVSGGLGSSPPPPPPSRPSRSPS